MQDFFVNIKEFTKNWKSTIAQIIGKMKRSPQLAIVQVGANEASNRYVKHKKADCAEVGIVAHHYWYEESITQEQLVEEVKDLNDHYDGIIVQLPLPQHINSKVVGNAIAVERDVDGFRKDSPYRCCTPGGIMRYLTEGCGWNPEGKTVLVIGRSDIVGKPMAEYMTEANATVILAHSKTKGLDKLIAVADLIVCAVGKANFLNCYAIHVPVVDVGINFKDGKLVGDCFNTEDRDVTPVPGGVGLLTRCQLLENVVNASQRKEKEK